MYLGDYENLLSVTSSFASHFADCMSLDEDVEVDADFLKTIEKFIEAVECLQEQEGVVQRETLKNIKNLHEELQKCHEEAFGCYEVNDEDIQTLSKIHSLIWNHCEKEWEKRRIDIERRNSNG